MRPCRLKWIIRVLLTLSVSLTPIAYIDAQDQGVPGDPVIIRIIELEHADAEALVISLQPFLSPQGRITAYAPANCLIIKDRQSIVNDLVRVIKGNSDP
jgi:type II secretory pathway component GspD/PulD (secretin)